MHPPLIVVCANGQFALALPPFLLFPTLALPGAVGSGPYLVHCHTAGGSGQRVSLCTPPHCKGAVCSWPCSVHCRTVGGSGLGLSEPPFPPLFSHFTPFSHGTLPRRSSDFWRGLPEHCSPLLLTKTEVPWRWAVPLSIRPNAVPGPTSPSASTPWAKPAGSAAAKPAVVEPAPAAPSGAWLTLEGLVLSPEEGYTGPVPCATRPPPPPHTHSLCASLHPGPCGGLAVPPLLSGA